MNEDTSMPTARKVLCAVYASIAVLAAIATWTRVGPYSDSLKSLFVTFWEDTKVTGASQFLAVDALFLALAVSVLFVVEARRLGIRFVWAYLIAGVFVGISVTAPLFLLARELTLGAAPMSRVKWADVALLGLFAIGIIGLAYYIDFV